jgi:hypothetical protein
VFVHPLPLAAPVGLPGVSDPSATPGLDKCFAQALADLGEVGFGRADLNGRHR